MQKLFIPEIGTELVLAQDWNFTLYPETRNEKLGVKHGVCKIDPTYTIWKHYNWLDGDVWIGSHPRDWDRDNEIWVWKKTYPIVLPKGTILRLDRIYIRKGNKEFSSLSFWVKNGTYKGCRFWAKLIECNEMIIE